MKKLGTYLESNRWINKVYHIEDMNYLFKSSFFNDDNLFIMDKEGVIKPYYTTAFHVECAIKAGEIPYDNVIILYDGAYRYVVVNFDLNRMIK